MSSVAFNSALIVKKIKTNEQNSENFLFHPLNLGSGSFSFERDFLGNICLFIGWNSFQVAKFWYKVKKFIFFQIQNLKCDI